MHSEKTSVVVWSENRLPRSATKWASEQKIGGRLGKLLDEEIKNTKKRDITVEQSQSGEGLKCLDIRRSLTGTYIIWITNLYRYTHATNFQSLR